MLYKYENKCSVIIHHCKHLVHTAKLNDFCVYHLPAKLHQRSYENAFRYAKPNNLLPRNT